MDMIKLARVYDVVQQAPAHYTILVDRLWPRGVKKTAFKPEVWMKEAAPSGTLRKWFGHDPEKWKEFKAEYKKELKGKKDELQKIKVLEKEYGTILLVYSARDTEHNQAVVLKEVLDRYKG